MVLHLDLETHTTREDILGFLEGNAEGTVLVPDRKEAYEHIARVLRRFSYWRLGKRTRGCCCATYGARRACRGRS